MTHPFEIAIRFENVCYKKGDLHILNQVSGVFYKGKITTIVGPSGAGKSTVLKMCNGLLSPTSGEIYIDGKNINEYLPTTLRKHVGIALQNAPLIRGTVYDNLSLPMTLQNKTLLEDEAVSILEDVGLNPKLLYRDSHDLSGGQKQKVSIARTLINKPKILLLDEITSSLDPTSTHEIEQLILKINEKYNVTMIWITHNLEQAIQIGNYTWVMMSGKLIESGESSLLHDSSNIKIQQFVDGGRY
ncbi:MAG: phosphate ABC transporter ATP-binding protein [Lysinibacillus sp.]|nr:phosphate ABC transporter ATP-binding protein [Lysinibacillus sp.]